MRNGGKISVTIISETVSDSESPQDMTIEQFLALQAEYEEIDLRGAQGQDMDGDLSRMDQIDSLMTQAPWTFDMDTGKVVGKTSATLETP